MSKLSQEQFIERVLSGELSRDQVLIHLTDTLHAFEKKYTMRSEVFFTVVVGTPAEDHPDFIAWAMCYRSYFRTLQSKFSLPVVTTNAV